MNLARRFTIATASIALTWSCVLDARSDEAVDSPTAQSDVRPENDFVQTSSDDVNESIEIRSFQSMLQSEPVRMVEDASVPPVAVINSAEYRRVYNSIPFNRAEFRANPNYRHDSAMEILTGHPRHQTIVQHNHEPKQPVQRIPAPARPSRVLNPFSGMGYFWNRPHWNYWGF